RAPSRDETDSFFMAEHALRQNMRAEIGAAFAAAVTMHADAGDGSRVLDMIPDEARQILQRRRAKSFDIVEELMVELVPDLAHAPFKQAEIEHHTARGIGRAAQAHLGPERMAVNLHARGSQCRS